MPSTSMLPTLLYGALEHDEMAFAMSILSDWVVVLGTPRNVLAWWFHDHVHVKPLHKYNITYCVREEDANDDSNKQTQVVRPVLLRRWNHSVSDFNLMAFSIKKEGSGTLNYIGFGVGCLSQGSHSPWNSGNLFISSPDQN
ncbi:hypothetical protein LINPERPRIM_LOCUS21449 [Linum perenne]